MPVFNAPNCAKSSDDGHIPAMITQSHKLREDVKFRILRLMPYKLEMTQRELAKEVGVCTGGIHYVLNARVEKGTLKLSNFIAAEDKLHYVYGLTQRAWQLKHISLGASRSGRWQNMRR